MAELLYIIAAIVFFYNVYLFSASQGGTVYLILGLLFSGIIVGIAYLIKQREESTKNSEYPNPQSVGYNGQTAENSHATWTCDYCGRTNRNGIMLCSCGKKRKVEKRKVMYPIRELERKEKYTISEADEIKKFKELADKGIITKEEFEAKKKQLLGL